MYLSIPTEKDEFQMVQMMMNWEKEGGRINPGVLRSLTRGYLSWLQNTLKKREENIEGEVLQTCYLLKDSEGMILGATVLRHELNDSNKITGGHIAYGIRPEQRKKGYGTLILKLALDKAREMGLQQVLITCDEDNIPSQKIILAHEGRLENRVELEPGRWIQRYWIIL